MELKLIAEMVAEMEATIPDHTSGYLKRSDAFVRHLHETEQKAKSETPN